MGVYSVTVNRVIYLWSQGTRLSTEGALGSLSIYLLKTVYRANYSIRIEQLKSSFRILYVDMETKELFSPVYDGDDILEITIEQADYVRSHQEKAINIVFMPSGSPLRIR